MDIDYKAAAFWWQVLLTAVNMIGWAYVIVTSKQKANTKAINGIESSINKLEKRISLVERDVENLPDHEDVSGLHHRINEANDKLSAMKGQLTQINTNMHLIHEFLLNGGK